MLKDSLSIDFIPILEELWRKGLLNLSEIKFHFTLDVQYQYEGKLPRAKIKDPTLQIQNSTTFSFEVKKLPISNGKF